MSIIISIITINYNNLEGLKTTAESIIGQSAKDYEWIIIDGGSTDGSRDFIESYQSRISYWCSEPDKGVYNAMNKGITKARGKYLCFMNSGDSFYDSEVLSTVINNQNDYDLIYGDTQILRGDKLSLSKPPSNISLRFLYENTINHQSLFVKRSVQLQFLYDEKYKIVSDRKFLLQCLIAGYTFHKVNIIVAKYNFDGYSSLHPEIGRVELDRVRKELFPDCVISEIESLMAYDQKETLYPELSLIKVFFEKNIFYRKFINKVLHLFLIFDKFCKR